MFIDINGLYDKKTPLEVFKRPATPIIPLHGCCCQRAPKIEKKRTYENVVKAMMRYFVINDGNKILYTLKKLNLENWKNTFDISSETVMTMEKSGDLVHFKAISTINGNIYLVTYTSDLNDFEHYYKDESLVLECVKTDFYLYDTCSKTYAKNDKIKLDGIELKKLGEVEPPKTLLEQTYELNSTINDNLKIIIDNLNKGTIDKTKLKECLTNKAKNTSDTTRTKKSVHESDDLASRNSDKNETLSEITNKLKSLDLEKLMEINKIINL